MRSLILNKKITFTFLISIILLANIYGQENNTKNITYSYTNDSSNIILSEQQFKAKPFYDKGFLLIDNNNFRNAIKPLKKAIKIDTTGNCGTGKDGMAYSELGYVYTRLKDFKNALIYLNKAIEINKQIPETYLSKANVFLMKKDKELALKTLDNLINYNPKYAFAYAQKGFINNSLNNYELAIKDFHKFLEIIKEQNEEDYSKELIDGVEQRIKELEQKINN